MCSEGVFAKIMAERTRFRGAALAASRGRPRGSGQPLWDHAAVGPSDLLSVFVIRRPVSELPVRRTTKTASCLRSRLHGPKRVAERTRFELVVRNDPYVGLANRWFQPLTHLSGSHLAKLPPRGRTAKIRIFFELQGFHTKKDSRGGCPSSFRDASDYQV